MCSFICAISFQAYTLSVKLFSFFQFFLTKLQLNIQREQQPLTPDSHCVAIDVYHTTHVDWDWIVGSQPDYGNAHKTEVRSRRRSNVPRLMPSKAQTGLGVYVVTGICRRPRSIYRSVAVLLSPSRLGNRGHKCNYLYRNIRSNFVSTCRLGIGLKFAGLPWSRLLSNGVRWADQNSIGKIPSWKDNVAKCAINCVITSAHDLSTDVGVLSTGDDFTVIELMTSSTEGGYRMLKNPPLCLGSAYTAS